MIEYVLCTAVEKPIEPVGTDLTRFIVTSVGGLPESNAMILLGFPKVSAVPVGNADGEFVRLILPTPSPLPVVAGALLGCVSVNEPVVRSPLVRASVPLTITVPVRVTPFALLMVRLSKVLAPIFCAATPLNSTVLPVLSVTPPLAVIFPVDDPLMASVLFVEPTFNVPSTTTEPALEITFVPQTNVPPELIVIEVPDAEEMFAPNVTVLPLAIVMFFTVGAELFAGVKLTDAAPPEKVRLFVPDPKLTKEVISPAAVIFVVAPLAALP